MANRMKVKYNKNWGDVKKINLLLFVTSLLDLRYKMASLEIIDSQLKWVLGRLYERYACGSKNVGSGSILSMMKCGVVQHLLVVLGL